MLNIQSNSAGRYLTGYCLGRSDSAHQQVEESGFVDDSARTCMTQQATEAGYCCELPVRYFGLPVRRKLIRMMLMLQLRAERGVGQHSVSSPSFSHALDYMRWVMDSAVLRGELRYRPAEELLHFYLSQAEEIRNLMASASPTNYRLRCEVRHRTVAFIEKYASGDRG